MACEYLSMETMERWIISKCFYISNLNVFVTEFKWFENLLDIPTCNTHEKNGCTVIVKPPLIYLFMIL